MHRGLKRTIRLFLAFAGALQFALPAIVSVADGILVHRSQAAEPWTDGVSDSASKSAHSVDCVLCWYLSTNVAEAGTPAPPAPPLPTAPTVEMPVARGVVISRPVHQSRAPPSLLS